MAHDKCIEKYIDKNKTLCDCIIDDVEELEQIKKIEKQKENHKVITQDNTEKYIKLIKNGSIKEIREFTMRNFHKIKHTDSFHAMINLLYDMENKLEETKKSINEIMSNLRNVSLNLINRGDQNE